MNYMKFVFAILCVMMISCTRMDGDIDDIDCPASENTGFVHIVRKDGVEFRLCLLNEQGEPSIVFKEGENFSFRFEMENLLKGDGRQYEADLIGDMFESSFCNVYTRDKGLVYAVFQRFPTCYTNFRTDLFDGENRLDVTIPLYDDKEGWSDGTCYHRRNSPVALPKGEYSTGFTYTFEYRTSPDIWVEVGPITMNIV
ncbi:MAG: hypothetical protein LBG28_15770, partial [Tannerella sp.]|nr:hypothetical protein [Tannerella sp.]